MYGQIYYVSFKAIAISAIQDLFEIVAPSDGVLVIHQVKFRQAAQETSENLRLDMIRAEGAYTSGSGGGTATITPRNTGQGASGITAERNNTTQALAGSGSLNDLEPGGLNLIPGEDTIWVPDSYPAISPTDAFIVALPVAPAASITGSATVTVELIGG